MRSILPKQSSVNDNFAFERTLLAQGFTCIVGCDEVGRGPLAGPVVAAAVSLPLECDHKQFKDSKELSAKQRYDLFDTIHLLTSRIGVGIVWQEEIDRSNILQASLLAMKIAVKNITSPGPDYLLVDGRNQVPVPTPQQTLIKGESKSSSIAAASIVAKVTRDRIMDEIHEKYPDFGFNRHKGYPTAEHRKLLRKLGPSPVHRRSFKGVVDHGQ